MKKFSLAIPDPCHQRWEGMAPVNKGRFCDSCQKTVIDFSEMSDSQLAEFFRKPPASVCGYFHQDQLGKEISIPRKTLPWARYFFQFTLPAFLLTLKSYSQKTLPARYITIEKDIPVKKEALPKNRAHAQIITGFIVDKTGTPIANASIILNNTGKGTASDSLGNFKMQATATDSSLVVSAIGYQTAEVEIAAGTIKITLEQKVSEMESVVIKAFGSSTRTMIAGGAMSRYTESRWNTTTLFEKITDTIAPSFYVYPNPVRSNAQLTVQSEKLPLGEYAVVIFDAKGAVVKISNLSLVEKRQAQLVAIENIASGSYTLCLRNKTSGKQYIKKLIVQ